MGTLFPWIQVVETEVGLNNVTFEGAPACAEKNVCTKKKILQSVPCLFVSCLVVGTANKIVFGNRDLVFLQYS